MSKRRNYFIPLSPSLQPATLFRLAFCTLAAIAGGSAQAHEFWLDPVASTWQVGQTFTADIRNGENFVGIAYPFDGEMDRSSELVSQTSRRPLNARLGDYPAINFTLEEPGLHVSLMQTNPLIATYDSVEAFQVFLEYHGLQDDIDVPEKLPFWKKRIDERYFRYAKTVFNVAPADVTTASESLFEAIAESDRSTALKPQELRYELVIVGASSDATQLELSVLLDGKPVNDRQIEVYHSAMDSGQATRSVTSTNSTGIAKINTSAKGDYLFNSVWITQAQERGADWETYWASLTVSH